MDRVYIPIIRIAERSVVTYSLPTERPRRTEKQEETNENLTRGKFKGVISDKSRRNLRRIAENWILSIQEAKKAKKAHTASRRKYITFVTLTLSAKQRHEDCEIKRELLNHFLIYCQRKLGVQEYIWRAESQANGNIHFHLFLDKYIHYQKLRDLWNSTQERLGYISDFKCIHGHNNPNSTDIERIRSAKGATIYVSKYIAKESEYRILQGRVWGCSDNLRSIMHFEEVADSTHWQLINHLKNNPTIKHLHEEHYSVFIGNIRDIITNHFTQIKKDITEHYVNNYKKIYP